MLRIYLLVAFRRMRRQPGYTAINVVGLALGLAGCLVIALFVWSEVDVDRFHADASQIYRLVQETEEGGSAWTGGAHASLIRESATGIEATLRIAPQERTITVPETSASAQAVYAEPGFAYADPEFFEVFSFRLRSGDSETALASPGAVVLSEATARTYFGTADPMGQVLLMYDEYSEPNQIPLTVTGVLEDPPGRSHIDVSVLASTSTLEGQYGPLQQFDWPGLYTYVKLTDSAESAGIAEAATRALALRLEEEAPGLRLQPVTEVYLHPLPDGETGQVGSAAVVYGLGSLALMVLLLACINFANLAVARATSRIQAGGVRRAVGAQRSHLMAESMLDTFVLIGFAVVLALGLVWAVLPVANSIIGVDLTSALRSGQMAAIAVMGLILVTGLVAGGYPAFQIARVRPTEALKGLGGTPHGSTRFRSGLIVFQFVCSITILVGTLVVHQQLDYVRTLQLGFDGDELLTVEAGAARRAFEPVRDAIQSVPGVAAVTAVKGVPGVQEVKPGLMARLPGRDEGGVPMHTQGIGPDFFNTLDMRLVAGRFPDASEDLVSPAVPFETPNRYLVLNETAVQALGWTPEEAIGKPMRIVDPGNEANNPGLAGTVSAVVADYHHGSARTPIPASTYFSARSVDVDGLYVISHVLVKLAPGGSADLIPEIRKAWNQVLPDEPFEAAFLDDQVQAQYEADLRLGRTLGVFASLAVLIACLGLLGLAALAAQQRTKEVGIRKTLGATVGQITTLLSSRLLKLVALAFVIAVPIAYVGLTRWLEVFAYRIELGAGAFLVTGAAVFVIALVTVSSQAFRAATVDPVRALRSE
ncbi:MAG: ABC transporter permease [Rubricoccaceae bacterium]